MSEIQKIEDKIIGDKAAAVAWYHKYSKMLTIGIVAIGLGAIAHGIMAKGTRDRLDELSEITTDLQQQIAAISASELSDRAAIELMQHPSKVPSKSIVKSKKHN